VNDFGPRLAELRRELGLNQAELAKEAGVSQATISRLESLESPPSDIRLLSRIAKAVKRPLSDFLPEQGSSCDTEFWAFCPNPRCPDNKRVWISDEDPVLIKWDSWAGYPSAEFDETYFCPSCGTELVKECPSCKRRFPRKGKNNFCVKCGQTIFANPTQKELDQIASEISPF
jgi:transcriptional regulator with XRE-family HTH domain